MLSIQTILDRSTKFLADHEVPAPRFEAEQLLAHCLGLTRMEIYLQWDKPLEESELQQLRPMLKRRGNREPLAWILGSKGFYDDVFAVRPGVLCPRPDTERLVDIALEQIPKASEEPFFVADIGCGSGCIGLSIAKARPNVRLFAVDISQDAIECTKENVANLELGDRVAVLKGRFFDPIPSSRTIDLVVSNPPYIPSKDLEDCEPEVSIHEPRIALDGGADGYDVYNVLIPMAAERARKAVAVEVGIHQAEIVRSIMQQAGLHSVSIHADLGGVERVVLGLV